jgi:hypothetical protein
MAYTGSYKLDWGSDLRKELTVSSGSAIIKVERGTVAIGPYVEEVLYVAPVEADPEADPPIEEVEEVEYVAPKPDDTCYLIHYDDAQNWEKVTATVGLFNFSGDADVRILVSST